MLFPLFAFFQHRSSIRKEEERKRETLSIKSGLMMMITRLDQLNGARAVQRSVLLHGAGRVEGTVLLHGAGRVQGAVLLHGAGAVQSTVALESAGGVEGA